VAEPLLPGDPRQLGPYYLDARLGEGGQGVVDEGYGPNGERVAAFCTAKVLHADLDAPVLFVASEYVPGPNLREAVERGGPYGVEGQEAVPQTFLRLVAPGERAEDTLRSARRADFTDGRTGEETIDRVLHAFTQAGVLVWDGDTDARTATSSRERPWPAPSPGPPRAAAI
jgi:hypothetical protein